MYQYSPYFMNELNKFSIPVQQSNTSKFFGNYNFALQPQRTFENDIEDEVKKYEYITNYWKNYAPIGTLEGYIKNIDKGMAQQPTLRPNQYIMPYSKGLLQYDPNRTQYSSPRTQEEIDRIKAYNELFNEMRDTPVKRSENEEYKMWIKERDRA